MYDTHYDQLVRQIICSIDNLSCRRHWLYFQNTRSIISMIPSSFSWTYNAANPNVQNTLLQNVQSRLCSGCATFAILITTRSSAMGLQKVFLHVISVSKDRVYTGMIRNSLNIARCRALIGTLPDDDRL